jgi:diaminopimelate epimerase
MTTKTLGATVTIPVSHYSGCGNDFLMIDNREGQFSELSTDCIKNLCQPKKGAGVDGLIMVTHSTTADVAMKYYNADGNEAEMCGNGCRCLMQYLRQKRNYPRTRLLLETKLRDLVLSCDNSGISVQMGQIHEYGENIALEHEGKTYYAHHCNTGVPHLVIFTDKLDEVDVNGVGRTFRFHERFSPQGTNVNFVEPHLTHPQFTAHIRTYERGVERETLACGTGVTAAAFYLHKFHKFHSPISLQVRSGEWLQVLFDEHNGKIDNVILKGPATWIRDGQIDFDPQSQHVRLTFTS